MMNTNKTNFTGLWLALTAVIFLVIGYLASQWINPPPAPSASVSTEKVETPSALDTEIEIKDAFIQSSGIKVEPVTQGSIESEIRATALVKPVPGGEATVIAKAAGTVLQIKKRLGDSVQAGETVAIVDSLEATRMTAERVTAVTKLELAKKIFARESTLFEKGVTPRQDMEAAQTALAVAEADASRARSIAQAARVAPDGRSILVVSPLSGRVTNEAAIVGAFVQPDSELFRIASNKQIQVEAFITAGDISKVQPGDAATIIGRKGEETLAQVRSVTPTVSGGNQVATVILTIEGENSSLVLGEGVQVRLHTRANNANGLVVPEDAVQNVEGQDVVFVRTKAGFKPQPVVVGMRSNGIVQLISGVESGVEVATKSAFLIKAEMIKNVSEED